MSKVDGFHDLCPSFPAFVMSLVKRLFAASSLASLVSSSLWVRNRSSHSPSQHGI